MQSCPVTATSAKNTALLTESTNFRKVDHSKVSRIGNGKSASIQAPAPSDATGAISSDKPKDNWSRGGDRRGCIKDAEKEYSADQVYLQVDRNKESFTHDKNDRAVALKQQQ